MSNPLPRKCFLTIYEKVYGKWYHFSITVFYIILRSSYNNNPEALSIYYPIFKNKPYVPKFVMKNAYFHLVLGG